MKNKILIICCTRGRPSLAKQMYISLLKTSSLCEVVFCIDKDDPKRKEYAQWMMLSSCIEEEGFSTTQLINKAFKMNTDYAFYSVTNDDVVYETKRWDVDLMNKGKISYGNDKCQGEAMPTISVVDGDICRALGWLQMPKLIHLFGDAVWKIIGSHLNILHYDKNVITNHKHFLYNKKTEKDDIYEITNSRDMYIRDGVIFKEWIKQNMNNDCDKIRRIL